MNTDRELMQQALEALEKNDHRFELDRYENDGPTRSVGKIAITAIREALAQPEQEPVGHGGRPMTLRECMEAEEPASKQEPVAWMHPDGRIWTFGRGFDKSTFTIPLYTTPPQRKPLTDDELYKVFPAIATYHEANKTLYRSIARSIEAAHGIGEKK